MGDQSRDELPSSGSSISWPSHQEGALIHPRKTEYPSPRFTPINPAVVPFEQLQLLPSKTYLCPICGMDFIDKARFRHHYMVHSGEKPYGCPMCSYRARQNSTLKQHMIVKHGS